MEAIIFTGIQASGKSTFFRERFFYSHALISLDLLKTRNREGEFLDVCIRTQMKLVVDNTNPTRIDRHRYVALLSAYRYHIECYHFCASVESCLQRNRSRDNAARIPNKGILSIAKKFEPPVLSEGFSRIWRVELVDQGFQVTLED